MGHMVRSSAAEKKLVPRAAPSAASSNPQSFSWMFWEKITRSTKMLLPISAQQREKKKFLCRDVCRQTGAGGTVTTCGHGSRSVQGLKDCRESLKFSSKPEFWRCMGHRFFVLFVLFLR